MNLINVDKNGNNIPIRIYKNEDGKYLIAISKKVGEGYDKRYYPVEFLKDVKLENETDIIIKHAFLTWFDWSFEDKTGTKFVIKITAFEKVENATLSPAAQPVLRPEPKLDKISSAKDIEPDDLPFY